MFMKRITRVGKTAPSRLVYEQMRETYFVENIQSQFYLLSTEASKKLVDRERKKMEIDLDYYTSPAMMDDRMQHTVPRHNTTLHTRISPQGMCQQEVPRADRRLQVDRSVVNATAKTET
ncbi:hypothetical protein ANN_00740 [Periplaneta americana]|uniref:Uncharacterized protein n=1 Tax=Periplaneta americana TaxID=6978 RepID=A0ABQ8TUH1_PERAM|nr:hypothetical protein ANN_00740 [Periplaneta americana]